MKVKKNQIRLLLGALLVITSIVIGQHTRGERQPSFQGKSLSFWLDQYLFNRGAGNDPEKLALREDARRAIRQIGSNGIPYLLKMLCERDSSFKTWWIEMTRKQRVLPLRYKPASVRNSEARDAFDILGLEASPAVPRLVEIYQQNLSRPSQSAAIGALGDIGPPASGAVPALLITAVNTNSAGGRVDALLALSKIGAAPATVVPLLISTLSEGDPGFRITGAKALANLGSNAQDAVPALTQLLNDNQKSVRDTARAALKKIAP